MKEAFRASSTKLCFGVGECCSISALLVLVSTFSPLSAARLCYLTGCLCCANC